MWKEPEAIKEHAFEPPVLQKAHMLSHILRNMTIYIQEGELVVGNHNDKPRCAPVFPEYFSEWVIDEIDDFKTRPSDPLEITDEDKKELVEVLEYWRGKSFDKVVERALSEEAKDALRAFDAACQGKPAPEKEKKKRFMDKLKETFED